jgi:tetratricopeptide (TPR) repeat protein
MYLGYLYSNTERFDEAEQVYARALIIKEKELGPEHSELADVLNGLGHVLGKKLQYADAEKHFLRALDICEKNPGQNPYALADALHNLGSVYFRGLDENVKAEAYFKRALELEKEVFGEGSVEMMETIENYAELLRVLGRDAEAEALESRYKKKENHRAQ